MKFNVICGTPRSGSTLLCNILNQNPLFKASSTSCLAQSVRSLSNLWSNSPEVKSDLIGDKEGTEARLVRSARAMVEAWYGDSDAEVIFDKGRLWNHSPMVLKQLFPEAHQFVCIRDLREILASIEKQHAKNPMLDEAQNPLELTTFNRADRLFSPQGIVGSQIIGVEDLMRRKLPNVHIIQYETLVQNPKLVIDSIYTVLGADAYEHDFSNVEKTATDVDGLYLGKFPHEGTGEVKPPENDWRDHVPTDIAGLLMERFQAFNQAFGYRPLQQS